MLTKKEYAMSVVNKFTNELRNNQNVIENCNLDSLVKHVYSSTSLGIALEILGVITKEKYPNEYEYLSNRAGIHAVGLPNFSKADKDPFVNILTERELYDMLPEEYPYDIDKLGAVSTVRIYISEEDGHSIMAQLAFAFGETTIIRWDDVEQRKKYSRGINAYTFIKDEREYMFT